MKAKTTASCGIRNRETSYIDAESIESTNAIVLTGFVHGRTESAILVHADDAPTGSA